MHHNKKKVTDLKSVTFFLVRPKGFEPLPSWSVADEAPTSNVMPLRPGPVSSPIPDRIAA